MDEITMIQVAAASSFAAASVLYWAARAAADGWFERGASKPVPARVRLSNSLIRERRRLSLDVDRSRHRLVASSRR